MVNLLKKRFNLFIFIFLTSLVFIVFRQLFNSYFEADEWFHFTYYLPLTQKPDGFFTALISTFTNSGPLSGGQHIIPIASAIFFLNAKFFGLNFAPYAFMTLLLHSINSFLVFLLIRTLLINSKFEFRNPKQIQITKKQNDLNVFENLKIRTLKIVSNLGFRASDLIALMGAIFFAIPSTAIHAVTGAAPFYGQNVLSVTFFLLCILFFKLAFIKENKKLVYLSVFFLFLALFSKETTTFLFILLPIMAILEKNAFSLKYLTKLYIFSLIVFVIFRFVIPNVYLGIGHLADKWVDNYITTANKSTGNKDTGTIVSTDRSIHKNIYGEVVFRAITYPVKMTSELYFPRQTVLSFMRFLTPVIYPLPSNITGEEETIRSQNYQFFMNGPGNDLIIYILSIIIIVIIAKRAKEFFNQNEVEDYKAIITGITIVVLSALPLALIVFSFPRWGYDTYFDSRHYYLPSVGGAILLPFILFFVGDFISKTFKSIRITLPSYFIVLLLFFIWLVNNMNVFGLSMNIIVDQTGYPRKQIIAQMKQYLPVLPKKAVIYSETDGLGAYGPLLPFQTSFPQILTIVYYPFPDSFYNKFIFDAKPEGYFFSEGRGLGFYNSKKTLSEALLDKKFSVDDIYGFYYDSQKIKLEDITQSIRREMKGYIVESKNVLDWVTYDASLIKLSFSYPPDTIIVETPNISESEKALKSLELNNQLFSANIKVFNVVPTLDINQFQEILTDRDSSEEIISKKVFYDKYHYNEAFIVIGNKNEYLIKFDDKLVYLTTQSNGEESRALVEKILGSVKISK